MRKNEKQNTNTKNRGKAPQQTTWRSGKDSKGLYTVPYFGFSDLIEQIPRTTIPDKNTERVKNKVDLYKHGHQ